MKDQAEFQGWIEMIEYLKRSLILLQSKLGLLEEKLLLEGEALLIPARW
jgi:hypothetical protein